VVHTNSAGSLTRSTDDLTSTHGKGKGRTVVGSRSTLKQPDKKKQGQYQSNLWSQEGISSADNYQNFIVRVVPGTEMTSGSEDYSKVMTHTDARARLHKGGVENPRKRRPPLGRDQQPFTANAGHTQNTPAGQLSLKKQTKIPWV